MNDLARIQRALTPLPQAGPNNIISTDIEVVDVGAHGEIEVLILVYAEIAGRGIVVPPTIAREEIVHHGCVIAKIFRNLFFPAHAADRSVVACRLWEIVVRDIVVSVELKIFVVDADVIVREYAARRHCYFGNRDVTPQCS